MVCRIDTREDVVLASHHPLSVFSTTAEHLDRIHRKPDGHCDREDVMTLVKQGYVVLHNEKVVRAVLRANEVLTFGCPRTKECAERRRIVPARRQPPAKRADAEHNRGPAHDRRRPWGADPSARAQKAEV